MTISFSTAERSKGSCRPMNQNVMERFRAYSLKEIEQILNKCDVRFRFAVLIMVSAGLRLDGLRTLQIGHIQKMDEFSLYMIKVYAGTRDSYYSFCSPECSAAIDEWLAYKAKHHEQSSAAPIVTLGLKSFSR